MAKELLDQECLVVGPHAVKRARQRYGFRIDFERVAETIRDGGGTFVGFVGRHLSVYDVPYLTDDGQFVTLRVVTKSNGFIVTLLLPPQRRREGSKTWMEAVLSRHRAKRVEERKRARAENKAEMMKREEQASHEHSREPELPSSFRCAHCLGDKLAAVLSRRNDKGN